VEKSLRRYFQHLEDEPVTDLHRMVMSEVEAPLLEAVMRYTGNNQSKAWINAGASYKLTNWLNIKVNYEDALEQKAVNATMNLYIEDDDIAYFLGLSGLSSLAK